MLIPKPPFELYRDCRVFGDSWNIWNCFGLGAYTTHIKYSRWIHVGMSYSFRNSQQMSFGFTVARTK